MDDGFRLYLRYSELVIRIAAVIALMLMTLVSALEVVMRAIFEISLTWAQELSILVAMWVYFFAYALVAKNYEYLRVELLFNLLPLTARRVVAPLCRMSVILFFGLVFAFGVQQLGFLALFRTNVLEIPEYWMIVPIILGALDVVVTELIYLYWQLRGDPVPGSADVLHTPHEH
jgi:TRAP-type C4-dicarboxylate transport system permease small subunit